uniref:Uncharacterized protein LOC104235792 n=1 Tax=Nicotiana sylvestris TaxID=4096 RepID=A0A1U7XE35_NICSY|nr:PREDICTED: uncharacterized protein LOC104235792 [Nicotiana sylvestris]
MDYLHTPIGLSVQYRPQTYNFKDYMDVWFNFLYVRPKSHTWFVKYSEQAQKSVIPRWFYDWWKIFGGTEQTMPRSFQAEASSEQIFVSELHFVMCTLRTLNAICQTLNKVSDYLYPLFSTLDDNSNATNCSSSC